MTTRRFVDIHEDAESNGFAQMLGTMLQQNLEDKPSKRAAFAKLKGRVSIHVSDLGIWVTIVFDWGHAVVHGGVYGVPDVTIRAPSDVVTEMSLVEIGPLGLPDPRGEYTKKIAQASKDGRMETIPYLRALPFILRLTQVMSVN